MWFMGFENGDCKDCYACARVCPVHAIKVKDKEAHIMRERCIVCGKCMRVCPQYAKVKSSIVLAKKFISNNKTVVASVSPSFLAAFGENSSKLPAALKKLGFSYVEESTQGIEPLKDIYEIFANDPRDKPYITSSCPAVVSLVQKHYSEIIPNLIPFVSSTIAHTRMLKQKYGEDCKVVFIGPCLARKVEAYGENSVDVVITFLDVVEWLGNEKVTFEKLEVIPFDGFKPRSNVLTITGDPIELIKTKNPKRNIIEVDGIKDCIQVLEAVKCGRFNNSIIEMSCCRHKCLQGVGMPKTHLTSYELKEKFYKYGKSIEIYNYEDECNSKNYKQLQFKKKFEPLNVPLKQPDKSELKKILCDMGRYKKEDEVNCASCGYHTCRQKAVAVYNGMAEIDMCLPFLREKAETLTNVIFDTVPEIIVIIDKELKITQLNNRAKNFFGVTENIAKGASLEKFLDKELFEKVRDSKQNIIKQKIFVPEYQATMIQSIIWVELNQVLLFFADDITEDEIQEKKHQQVKYDAINMAQQVINKQMVVAQQIASLLGETTGETKATLTKLKNLIQEEEDRK